MSRNGHHRSWSGLGPSAVAACEDELALIVEHRGAGGARRQTPRKRGVRFSMKARWPSR
jgi:hypothetical protein